MRAKLAIKYDIHFFLIQPLVLTPPLLCKLKQSVSFRHVLALDRKFVSKKSVKRVIEPFCLCSLVRIRHNMVTINQSKIAKAITVGSFG